MLAELCERLGAGTGALSSPMVTALVAEAVPFYAGLTLDEIGGDGVRWQDRDAASALPSAELSDRAARRAAARRRTGCVLAPAPTLWSGPGGRVLALAALPRHRRRAPGSPSRTRAGTPSRAATRSSLPRTATSVNAVAVVRTAVPEGSVFLSPPARPGGAGGDPRTAQAVAS